MKIRIALFLALLGLVPPASNVPVFGQTDDWPTEAISSRVQDDLKVVIKNSLDNAQLGSGVAEDATCTMLKAADLEVIRDLSLIHI